MNNYLTPLLGRLLGLDEAQSIAGVEFSFAAGWAQRWPWLIALLCAGALVLSLWFYKRWQPTRRVGVRMLLSVLRGLALAGVLLILAEPVLSVKLVHQPRPMLWVLFDGTESMSIADDLPASDAQSLRAAVGLEAVSGEAPPMARQEFVQALVKVEQENGENVLAQLAEEFRLRAFLLDRPGGVRSLTIEQDEKLDLPGLAAQLESSGEVTALGAGLDDLARRHAASHLAGLVVFSDFDQNAGPSPLPVARKLGVPIFAVGVGPSQAVDLGVELQAPLLLKKSERVSFSVTLRQTGLDGLEVAVRLLARRLGGASLQSDPVPMDMRTVVLNGPETLVEFPYTPSETGHFELTAEVDPLPGEVVEQNNRSAREVNIRDDFLRLMFVEYEPTWEWRFIKEVFHRDKLVGERGFRTFLYSADPKVRETNPLFLPTATPARSEFFANDVIFLGDMPAERLSPRFCELLEEFVSTFGGGLVVLSGPRFGPAALAQQPTLAKMLPVVIESAERVRDDLPFTPRLTANAAQFDFMRLGQSENENAMAWGLLGRLPWYQPVARPHPLATTVLMEHPRDKCVDGRTPQPLMAIRRYGRGEVVYLAFNETWRLRRQFGELYYRQFWGQMIYRLGLSHALGSQKRFVVSTDRQQYQADDKVVLTVEAYDENFEPLTEEQLPDRRLTGELVLPGRDAAGEPLVQPLSVPELREGVFEARVSVFAAGEHRIRVLDPETNEHVEVRFQVTNVSAERRSAVRNVALQQELAAAHPLGRSFDLADVAELPGAIQAQPRTESSIQILPLWNTWAAFLVVLVLWFVEWLVRKWVHLA